MSVQAAAKSKKNNGLRLAQVLNERRRMADQGESIDLSLIQRRRFDRFLNNMKEGRDYTFLSVYFYTIDEAHEIATELKTNGTLQYLSMPNCYAGRRKIKPIMDALKSNNVCRLVYLDLNDNRLEDIGCFMVCDFLKQNRTVKSVALKANRITSKTNESGARYLSEVLKINPIITRLDIGQNKLGPEGALMIDSALAKNKSLTFLDISDNELLAEGVKNLQNLFTVNNTIQYLRLQHNNIGLDGAEQIAFFLSQNVDTKIEQLTLLDKYTRVLVLRGLMERCRSQDLTEKFLKKILLKKDFYDRKFKTVQAEWVSAKEKGQELVKLPQEVFEYQDAAAIKTYLKAALNEGLSANKAVKMLMVGRARAGKTSLTNSLVNDKKGLTKDDDNRATVSVEIRPWKVKDVTISIWDFAGQEEYYMTHTFFLSRRCVVVLIVDLAAYKDFQEDVYYWVKAIQAHVPGVTFFMVGTHIDQMTPEEIKEKSDEILIKFQEEERAVVAALDKQIELLQEANVGNYTTLNAEEKHDKITADEAEIFENEYVEGEDKGQAQMDNINKNNKVVYLDDAQMARIREQKDRRPSILHNKVFAVSAKDMEGVADLRTHLISHATDEEVAIRLPNNYVQLLDGLKRYGESNPTTPILARTEVPKVIGPEIAASFSDEGAIDAALELLHLVGQLLWYRTNNQLRDRVFVSPRWVVDITKALVRHDMFKTEHGNPGVIERLQKPNNMKSKVFNAMKKKFRKEAIFDLRFLELLDTWKDISEINRYKLVSLLQEFDIMVPLPKRKKSDNEEALIPLYLKSSFHGKAQLKVVTKEGLIAGLKKKVRKSVLGVIGEELATKDLVMDQNRIIWRYDLKEYFPEGIFYRVLVRCYSLGKVKQIDEDLLYCKLGNDIKIIIKEDRPRKCILLAASHKTNLQRVWPALVLFATEFEDLLREAYRGVTCQIVCIAANNTLRERALCNHDENKDMVPPIEYMHVVWGNINAVQVGVLLRMNNIKRHLEKLESQEDTENKYEAESETNLLAKEAFSLFERLCQNICKVNDIPIKNGRNMKAYLSSIENSEVYAESKSEDSAWKGEILNENKLSAAYTLYTIFTEVSSKKDELLDLEFVEKVIEVSKTFMPDLAQFETEFEVLQRNNAAANLKEHVDIKKMRGHLFNDVLKKIDIVKPATEAIGKNEELAFVVENAKDTGIKVNTVKDEVEEKNQKE